MDKATVLEMLLNRCSASFKGDYINLFSVEETKGIADFIEQQAKELKTSNDYISVVNPLIDKLDSQRRELSRKIEQQEPYAELGRLAVEEYICDYEFNDYKCLKCNSPDKCGNYEFCQKRAELRKLEG